MRLKRNSTDKNIFGHDYNLDIFEQTISTNEPIEKLVKKELLIFKRYSIGCQKHQMCSSMVAET